MALTQTPPATDEPSAVTVAADPEQAQRAEEANVAIILMACLFALVAGTQLLVAFLGQFS